MKLQANSLNIIVSHSLHNRSTQLYVYSLSSSSPSIKTCVCSKTFRGKRPNNGEMENIWPSLKDVIKQLWLKKCCYYLQPMLFLYFYKGMVKMLFKAVVCSKDN